MLFRSFLGLLFGQSAGIDLTPVPYKGTAQGIQDLLGGQVLAWMGPLGDIEPFYKSGKVKIIGVLEKKRLPDLPDLPAMGESIPDYEKVGGGVDLYGPAGISAPITKRIENEMQKAMATPEVRSRMKEIAFFYDGTALDEMGAQRRRDIEVVARAIKAAGLKPE